MTDADLTRDLEDVVAAIAAADRVLGTATPRVRHRGEQGHPEHPRQQVER